MKNYIELKKVGIDGTYRVRPENIAAMDRVQGGTELYLAGGHVLQVRETRDEIERRERNLGQQHGSTQ